MKVLVTGGRNMTDAGAVLKALVGLSVPDGERLTIIHGAASGADSHASWAAEVLGANEYKFPAEWEAIGRGAGPARNQEMLDTLHPDIVLAFPGKASRGTHDMIARAAKAGVAVVVHQQQVD